MTQNIQITQYDLGHVRHLFSLIRENTNSEIVLAKTDYIERLIVSAEEKYLAQFNMAEIGYIADECAKHGCD